MSLISKISDHEFWRWRRQAEAYLFVVPTVVILLVLLVYPLIYTMQISFSEFSTSTMKPSGFAGLDNYSRVVRDRFFWESLRVTLLYLLGALPLQMVLGTAIAFVLAVNWSGIKIVRALFLIPMVVTPVVAGSVWKTLLDPLWGYINHVISALGGQPIAWFSDPTLALVSIVIIDSWTWTPFVILIVLAGIMGLDLEPLEAAQVDGASWWQTMIYVKLPMLTTVILSAFVVRWLGAIKMFDIIYATTRGGPGNATEVINLYIYDTSFRGLGFEKSATMAVMIVVAALVLTFAFIRLSEAK
jgi:multiple sugar transport system permease protein